MQVPDLQWLLNNGFAVFIATILIFVMERRLTAINNSLQQLINQIAVLSDRQFRYSQKVVSEGIKTKIVDVAKPLPVVQLDTSHEV